MTTNQKNKKILVIGGAGFIGSHLAEYLIKKGHKVIVYDNFSTGKNRVKGADIIKGDILENKHLKLIIKGVDEVFHLAAAVGVRYCYNDPEVAYRTNIIGSHNVVEACKELRKPMVFASSSAVYGKIAKAEVSEDDDVLYGCPSKLEWLYSYYKAVEEGRIIFLSRREGYNFKTLRLFNVIGTRQVGEYGMVVPRFISWALRNEPIQVYEKGEQRRSFTDVRDAVRALIWVMENGRKGEVYNFGGQEEIKIKDLAEKIKMMTNSTSEIKFIPYAEIFGKEGFEETQRRKPNIDKIEHQPIYKLEDTLRWIIENKKI